MSLVNSIPRKPTQKYNIKGHKGKTSLYQTRCDYQVETLKKIDAKQTARCGGCGLLLWLTNELKSWATIFQNVQILGDTRLWSDQLNTSLFLLSSVSVFPAKRRNRHSVSGLQVSSRSAGNERAPVRRSNTMPPNLGGAGILGRLLEERSYGNAGLFPNVHFIIQLYRHTSCRHSAVHAQYLDPHIHGLVFTRIIRMASIRLHIEIWPLQYLR